MDIRKVKKLIEMLEESSLAEIEIKEGEESIRISRASSGGQAVTQVMAAPAARGPRGPPRRSPPLPTRHRLHSYRRATW